MIRDGKNIGGRARNTEHDTLIYSFYQTGLRSNAIMSRLREIGIFVSRSRIKLRRKEWDSIAEKRYRDE